MSFHFVLEILSPETLTAPCSGCADLTVDDPDLTNIKENDAITLVYI